MYDKIHYKLKYIYIYIKKKKKKQKHHFTSQGPYNQR